MTDYSLNCRGMQCPGPIMQLFTADEGAQPGDTATISVTDMGFKKDIEAWCRKTKNELGVAGGRRRRHHRRHSERIIGMHVGKSRKRLSSSAVTLIKPWPP